TQANQIARIDGSGAVSVFAGTGKAGFADGASSSAQFSLPTSIGRLPDGTLVVADAWNQRIRAVTPDGTVSTYAGNGQRASVDGPAAAASFYFPFALAARADGTVIVVESDTGLVRQIGNDPGHTVSILAGARQRDGWDDGTLDVASVHEIVSVAAGAGGDVVL